MIGRMMPNHETSEESCCFYGKESGHPTQSEASLQDRMERKILKFQEDKVSRREAIASIDPLTQEKSSALFPTHFLEKLINSGAF